MSSAKIIGGLAMMAGGYAIAYYGANVLMWAHGPDESTADPIPLSHLFGFPSESIGDPGEFMPPFKLGAEIPGSITDARGLLGGTATTGSYNAPEWTAQSTDGTGELGSSTDDNKTGGGTGVPPSGGGASSIQIPGSNGPTGFEAGPPNYPDGNVPSSIDYSQSWTPGGGLQPTGLNPNGTSR